MGKFQLGQVVATPNALEHVRPEVIGAALIRHENGDWGVVDPDDAKQNDLGLDAENPDRLMSVWPLPDGAKFWIITEWDRSVTTILMPEDY